MLPFKVTIVFSWIPVSIVQKKLNKKNILESASAVFYQHVGMCYRLEVGAASTSVMLTK